PPQFYPAPLPFSGLQLKISINSMSDWHDCCNTTSREDGAFKVLCYPVLRHAGGDFDCRRSRKRECGYSLAFSIAPNAALSRPLYYDRRRLDHCLAEGRYSGTITLIFSSALSRAKWMAPNAPPTK